MRASCWVSVLPPSASDRLRTSRTTARASPMGSTPGCSIEPAIFDGDDGMLEIGGDLIQRDVAPLFIEPEPGLRVGAVEDRVADASRQTIDRERVTGHPPRPDGDADEHQGKERQPRPVEPSVRPAKRAHPIQL